MKELIERWRKDGEPGIEDGHADWFSVCCQDALKTTMRACADELEAATRLRPMEEAPKDEPVLVKHERKGWIEATQVSKMLVSDDASHHLFPWNSPADEERWIHTDDLLGWLPLPEVDE